MAPAKRPSSNSKDPESKRAKAATIEAESSGLESREHQVVLNAADCDLDFDIDGGGLRGSALHEKGFAYCWSGARANVGITGGKYCFGCKIIATQPVDMDDTPADQQHVCRVGFSRGNETAANLGETDHSFGFGGTGKFSNAGKFSDYGEKFGVGDVIVCAVDLECSASASIGFSKNGKWLGVAKAFDNGRGATRGTSQLPWGRGIFPHVLLKNVVVRMLFGSEDGLVVENGYAGWSSSIEDGRSVEGPKFSVTTSDCEVMMMVGLPAAGKTTWAENRVKSHPEKRYVLLGTNLALDQMKVPGLMRKHNYGERFEKLMNRATGIFNTLLGRASRTNRNYIIDQTNVYKSARTRKMRPFHGFRKTAVVVFPTPEDLKARSARRFGEMGKEVPADAVNEMIANFVFPSKDESFDETVFPELQRDEAQLHLNRMKEASGKKRRTEDSHARKNPERSAPGSQRPLLPPPLQSLRSHFPRPPPAAAPAGAEYGYGYNHGRMGGYVDARQQEYRGGGGGYRPGSSATHVISAFDGSFFGARRYSHEEHAARPPFHHPPLPPYRYHY